MGVVLNYQCGCGYKREVCIGAGLRASRTDILSALFSDDELADFRKAETAGDVTSHLCENILGFCPACNEYHTVSFFHYTCRDGASRLLTGTCPICAHAVTQIKETTAITCPNCRKLIEAKQTGYWD